MFRVRAVTGQYCVSFTANCVGVIVLVAVGEFEMVAVRRDSSMALCADPKEAHGVEG